MRIYEKKDREYFLSKLKNRQDDKAIQASVLDILEKVKLTGDQALRDYTLKFDGVDLDNMEVRQEEIDKAMKSIDPGLYKSLRVAKDRIEDFHSFQKPTSQYQKGPGYVVGEKVSPICRVGIYVPGGKAAYPSTVLMNALPAKIAGVKEVIMVTPPCPDGSVKTSVLVAARLAGVDKVYRVGGAQAIGALTYGTQTIRPVDKIVGPGNQYVSTAKHLVSDRVGIDMIAGPSEVLILADQTSDTGCIVADLIAQAEHDERASSMVLVEDKSKALEIQSLVKKRLEECDRKEIVTQSINTYGGILLVDDLEDMIVLANQLAPEHLEILTEDSEKLAKSIDHAGAIFVGPYSPEALGDYLAGPNHTLPTNQTARFSSPLGVYDFIKRTSYINYEKKAFDLLKDHVITIAEDEGLMGHAQAIRERSTYD